jgi:release factor-specific protein-(glutamine-N5) methyltransferase
MNDDDFEEYQKRIYARIEGKPLQYILGVQEFMGLPFRVNPSVLIPRLDTEVLVEKVIDTMNSMSMRTESPEVLDLCTGSGAVGVSIASKVPGAIVTMTDVSEEALSTAMGNAGLNGVNRRCIFLLGDMFEAVPDDKHYDVIVCNPPYIPSDVIETLDIEVKDHEPRMALDGGKDGLDFYRIIANQASLHLKTGGILALEIGCDQAADVKKLLNDANTYEGIRVIRDLAQLDRVIIAIRK